MECIASLVGNGACGVEHEAVDAEDFLPSEDLRRNRLRVAENERSLGASHPVELLSGQRRPATFAPDAVHVGGERGVHLVGGFLVAVGDVAEAVDGQRDRFRVEARLGKRPAVEAGERSEPNRVSSDDGERHRQTELRGPHDRGRCTADAHPDRERILLRAGVDRLVVERRTELAAPGDPFVVSNLDEEIEFLGEEFVVVLERLAEERKRLDERTAADEQLGPPRGDEVERREVLERPDRVGRAEDDDG